jgi:hypothetical protein
MGSLKHDVVPTVAWELREHGFDVFDDWHASGPEADHHWRNYEVARGKSYKEALQSPFANTLSTSTSGTLTRATLGFS